MKIISELNKSGIKDIMPGIIVILIVAVSITSVVNHLEAVDGWNVTAEADPVIIPNTKKKKSDKSTKVLATGDIDLSKCADGTFTGRGQGYAGYLEVDVTIKNHTITKIKFKKNQADDAPYLAKAKKIIPKVVKAQSLNVDTASGATYSSNGILSAIKDALKQAAGKKSSYKNKKKKNKDYAYEDGEYNDGVFTGSAKAFKGNIDVAVTIKTGKLNAINITKTQDDEKYLTMAKTVIAAMLKKQTPNVDTVTGATYSSKGIINATKQALNKARKKPGADDNKNDKEDDYEDKDPETLNIKYIDGKYHGTGIGYNTSHMLAIEVLVSETKITEIELVDHEDDEEYIIPAFQVLVSKIKKRQGTNGIDTIAGATYSSLGILDAVNDALKDAVLDSTIP